VLQADAYGGFKKLYAPGADGAVTGRCGPPYAAEFVEIIYVVTDVVMDVVNEVSDAAGDFDGR